MLKKYKNKIKLNGKFYQVIEKKPVEENRIEEDRGERKPYTDKYKQSYYYKNEDREKVIFIVKIYKTLN